MQRLAALKASDASQRPSPERRRGQPTAGSGSGSGRGSSAASAINAWDVEYYTTLARRAAGRAPEQTLARHPAPS